jgi:hypothetical protein
MSKTSFQIKHVTKDRGNKCGKVEDYKYKRWVSGMVEETRGRRAWHGEGAWWWVRGGIISMSMDIHACGRCTWAWGANM